MKVVTISSPGGLPSPYGGVCLVCGVWSSDPVIDAGPYSFFDFILNGIKAPRYCHYCFKHLGDVDEFSAPLC
jgi:hypothetical protein